MARKPTSKNDPAGTAEDKPVVASAATPDPASGTTPAVAGETAAGDAAPARSAADKPATKKPETKKPAPKKPVAQPEPEEDDDEDDEDEDDDEDDDDEDDEIEDEHPVFTAKEAAGALTGLFKFIWPFIIKYPKWLGIVVFGLLVETAFNVVFPLSLKYLIDEVLQNDNHQALVWILVTLGTLGIIVSIITIWYEYVDALLMSSAMADIRAKLFEHLQSLSAGFYSRTKTGAITSRFGSDMGTIDEAVSHLVTWGMLPALELVAGIGLMFFLNWQLALVALLLFPVALIGPRLLSGPAVDAAYQERRAAAGLVSVVQENVSAQNVVKAFELKRTAMRWFGERNDWEKKQAIRHRFLNAMVERSVTISVLMLHLLIFGLGAYLTYNEEITLGTFITFESVFWELSYNIGHVTQFMPVAISGSGATRHINDLFHEPARNQDPADAPGVPRISRDITFRNVDFSYGGEKKQLEGVSMTIPAGSRVAVVGPSGSGKSTVLNLLMRLYDPVSGTIKVDDTDIVAARRDSLREQMAIVFQDNLLFDISIRENIRLGNPAATDQEVERAAKTAEIHRFIKSLPNGYDTVVGERGNMMSGGQRQRVAIARAIVRNPSILLLDEATSALDHGTEQAINKTLMKVSAGRTMITVTHRLHSVTEMDKIFVMEAGRLVEEGTHAELVHKKGVYATLWKQAG